MYLLFCHYIKNLLIKLLQGLSDKMFLVLVYPSAGGWSSAWSAGFSSGLGVGSGAAVGAVGAGAGSGAVGFAAGAGAGKPF